MDHGSRICKILQIESMLDLRRDDVNLGKLEDKFRSLTTWPPVDVVEQDIRNHLLMLFATHREALIRHNWNDLTEFDRLLLEKLKIMQK